MIGVVALGELLIDFAAKSADAGGSPTMAHDIREVEEAVAGVNALVCNLGAIGDVEAMLLAGKKANELGIPVLSEAEFLEMLK